MDAPRYLTHRVDPTPEGHDLLRGLLLEDELIPLDVDVTIPAGTTVTLECTPDDDPLAIVVGITAQGKDVSKLSLENTTHVRLDHFASGHMVSVDGWIMSKDGPVYLEVSADDDDDEDLRCQMTLWLVTPRSVGVREDASAALKSMAFSAIETWAQQKKESIASAIDRVVLPSDAPG
jgi:hypothetical protein